jgi:hypothetical protein
VLCSNMLNAKFRSTLIVLGHERMFQNALSVLGRGTNQGSV